MDTEKEKEIMEPSENSENSENSDNSEPSENSESVTYAMPGVPPEEEEPAPTFLADIRPSFWD